MKLIYIKNQFVGVFNSANLLGCIGANFANLLSIVLKFANLLECGGFNKPLSTTINPKHRLDIWSTKTFQISLVATSHVCEGYIRLHVSLSKFLKRENKVFVLNHESNSFDSCILTWDFVHNNIGLHLCKLSKYF